MLRIEYDEQKFSAEVIERFGSLTPDLAADGNLLHCQMATLTSLMSRDAATANSVLLFLEAVVGRSDAISEIENAVAISFLEWPEFKARPGWVETAPVVAEIIRAQWQSCR